MSLPAVEARSFDDRRVSRWFTRCRPHERHWMTAGFTLGGFDTRRDFGFVDIVVFLAVWAGDFH